METVGWFFLFVMLMVSYAIMENKKGHFGKVYFSKLLPDDRFLMRKLELVAHLNPIVTFGCVLLPAFVLRRLHVVIFIVLGLKLLDFLTKGD